MHSRLPPGFITTIEGLDFDRGLFTTWYEEKLAIVGVSTHGVYSKPDLLYRRFSSLTKAGYSFAE